MYVQQIIEAHTITICGFWHRYELAYEDDFSAPTPVTLWAVLQLEDIYLYSPSPLCLNMDGIVEYCQLK